MDRRYGIFNRLSGNVGCCMLFYLSALQEVVSKCRCKCFIATASAQEHLLQINSIYSVINSLMMFLSPIISGLLLTLMPLEIAFFLDVITALIGNGIMLLVRVDSQS